MSDANDWVHYRLVDWSEWAMGGFDGGYPKRSPFVVDRVQSDRGFIEISPEIEITDTAVAKVRLEARWKWRVIQMAYLGRKGDVEIALTLRKSMDATRQMLWSAKSAVGRYISVLERQPDYVIESESQCGSLTREKVAAT